MPDTQRRVGQYEILGVIGRGGMATVHLAYDEDLDRHVALKELDLRSDDRELVDRFLRESRLAARLSHQNIVTVFGRPELDGVPFIAMEYLDRGSLRPFVGQLSQPQVLGVLEWMLAGLEHAHQQGIVHRDLKPENLLVTSEGGVKIGDFGIAKAMSSATRGLTRRGAALGTYEYMSPEQVMAKPVGPPSDLYGVGVIAFELVCGRVPFEGSDEPAAVLFRHVNEPPPDPRSLQPDTDERLAAWILRMLAKTSEDRPQTAREASEGLEEIAVAVHGSMWRREARLTGDARPPPARPTPTPTPPPSAPVATPPPSARVATLPPSAPVATPPPALHQAAPGRTDPRVPPWPPSGHLVAIAAAATVGGVLGAIAWWLATRPQMDTATTFYVQRVIAHMLEGALAAVAVAAAAHALRWTRRGRLRVLLEAAVVGGLVYALVGWPISKIDFGALRLFAAVDLGTLGLSVALGLVVATRPRRATGIVTALAGLVAGAATALIFGELYYTEASIDFIKEVVLGTLPCALAGLAAALVLLVATRRLGASAPRPATAAS